MHALFELLLRERPEDPYSFIAARFREAALLEPQSAAIIDPIPVQMLSKEKQIARSNVSTAPTSTVKPASVREEPQMPLPEGVSHVTIRSMRGRTLARMPVKMNEPIGILKERLEAHLGVSAKYQTMLWWAEAIPNGATLEDFFVPRGIVTLHLVRCGRDPRLKRIISGSSTGGLKLHSLEDGELVKDLSTGGPTTVLSMAADWEGKRVLTGCLAGSIQLWHFETGLVRSLEGHTEEVGVLIANWPSMKALSGSGDGTARLWDLATGNCIRTLTTNCTIISLVADWPSDRACTGLRNGNVWLWNMETGEKMQEICNGALAAKTAGTAVSAVSIDIAGRRAASGFEDGHLAYWHFENPAGEAAPKAADDKDNAAAVVAATSSSTTVTPTKVLLAHYSAIRAIDAKWTESESKALCGSDDGSLSFWNLGSQECLARFARHIGMVWTLYADWQKDRAVSGAFDGCLKLWDLRTGECLRTFQGHSRPVRSVCASAIC
jgi:WD40 repeat protein